jgi:hypothetical protein
MESIESVGGTAGAAVVGRGGRRRALGAGAMVLLALTATPVVFADLILDWETDDAGLPLGAGQIIDDELAGFGVGITAINARRGHPDLAVIFDSNNPTGGDDDLATPGFHPSNTRAYDNILILQERGSDRGDGFIDEEPDDEAGGGSIRFDLDFVASTLTLDLIDTEEKGGVVELFRAGASVGSMDIPATADNALLVLAFEAASFDEFHVNFAGSGAIAEIAMTTVPSAGTLAPLAIAGLFRRRRRR